jgi:hypothetical protein
LKDRRQKEGQRNHSEDENSLQSKTKHEFPHQNLEKLEKKSGKTDKNWKSLRRIQEKTQKDPKDPTKVKTTG